MHTFLIMKKKLGSELIPTSHLIRVLWRSCQPPRPWKGGAAEGSGPCWAPAPSPASGIYRETPKRNSVMLFLIIHLFGNELLDFSVQSSLATCSQQKREQWTWAFRVVRREMVCKSLTPAPAGTGALSTADPGAVCQPHLRVSDWEKQCSTYM